MILDERQYRKLQETHKQLYDTGELLSRDRLEQCYGTFRERFSPSRLQSLDGEALLETMHNTSNYDSLAYWLEFKNDEEFPAHFGSIAGGSALKFGIYRRKETGIWMTGSPQKQRELSLDEAIQVARKHRDQLVQGAELLERFPLDGDDEDYRRLQEEMIRLAPDVAETAWGHKYFCLLHPDKLEDFHVVNYQHFYLVKLLQPPPEGEGRYLAAGRFVAIARELEIHVHDLAELLWRLYGRPHRYWRIGTTPGGTDHWEQMRGADCVVIGWPELGDLSHLTYNTRSKEYVREGLDTHYPNAAQAVGRITQQVFNFVTVIGENDLVLPSWNARNRSFSTDHLAPERRTGPYWPPGTWLRTLALGSHSPSYLPTKSEQ
jgi:5-methylcytosine-specific restriction protein B